MSNLANAATLLEWTLDGLTVLGPIGIEQLKQAVTGGQIPLIAHARTQGTVAWLPISQLFADLAPSLVPGTSMSYSSTPRSTLPFSIMHMTLSELQKQAALAEAAIVERRKELESVEEAIEIQSFGFYRPHYRFDSAHEYAAKLKSIRESQKEMIREDAATACPNAWTVGGSSSDGKKMVKNMSKLMLRAFNGECDSAIAKVKFDNVENLEQRIAKSYRSITRLGESYRITINLPYYDLKLAELRLVHEHREKLHEERENQRQAKEQIQDELKAQEEIDKAKTEAEEEEARFQGDLAAAKAELAAARESKAHEQSGKLDLLISRIERIEVGLKAAIEQKARAMARAQLTRSGHVYVISNIGSFGPDVYKIGLTRRFEPLERIYELGSASVPFPFDVHAIIYSEDAPALEAALHQKFSGRRLNRVNGRKEYFRASLEEIRAAVEKCHGLVTFVLTPEAEQWRKTQVLVAEGEQSTEVAIENATFAPCDRLPVMGGGPA